MYLKEVCDNIQETIRASYATIPPPDLGEPGTSKLKAGKWMVLIEFDLLVTLVKILHSNPGLETAPSVMTWVTHGSPERHFPGPTPFGQALSEN
jgi:hypothetical protein